MALIIPGKSSGSAFGDISVILEISVIGSQQFASSHRTTQNELRSHCGVTVITPAMDASISNNSNSSTKLHSGSVELTMLGTSASFISASLICLLIIAALVANIFVCYAVYKQRSARQITRYFIINLCIADIFVTLISMPVWLIFRLYSRRSAVYLLGETFVAIWRHVDIMCGTASILSLTSISVDRYIAVTKPYFYVGFMTAQRAMQVIGGIWMYSMTVALLLKPLGQYRGGRYLHQRNFFRACIAFYKHKMG